MQTIRTLQLRKIHPFCVLLALFIALLTACAEEPDMGEANIGVATQALSASSVTKLTVTVSGPGISPNMVQNLVKTNGNWVGTIGGIPAGANRTFLAQAYDASNSEIYGGQAVGVTVTKGVTAAVVIVLQQT